MGAPRIAILGSGQGTNFESIQKAVSSQKLSAEIVAVLSDKPDAPVLDRARAHGIRALTVPGMPGEKDRAAHDRSVLEALAPLRPDFLVLAGYMRIVTATLLEAFRSPRGYTRVVNVHPSLLPSFPGLDGYAQAFRYGVKTAGVTVHLVELDVDSGPICAQEGFSIAQCKSVEEVRALGQAVEHRLYPDTLSWVLAEKFDLETRDERMCIRVRAS